jgi:SNF2 family DNA or RNA helicase
MEARTNTVNSFQAGELKFLLCHAQSAGHGLTLTRGIATIWASPTDNAEHYMQANARIWRGGQTQKTETILISAQGTIEEKAYKALTEKVTNMNDLLGLLE